MVLIKITHDSVLTVRILYILPLKPLAAEAGLTILKQGGNAADAAVAVAAALNVTQPTSTGNINFVFDFFEVYLIFINLFSKIVGLGGDAFVLYFDAAKKEVRGINGR